MVTVAIADVGWYVRPGTALDREAVKRGNSVYFPDRVVPMLPERISNDLCSLREGEDRPALAVRMVFSRRRTEAAPQLPSRHDALGGEALLPGSAARLRRRGDRPRQPRDRVRSRRCGTAYRDPRRGRDDREPLDLDLPERKVLLGADGGIERIVVPERLEAHRLIEEFMIQANVAAAETLEAKKSPLVYRIHDAPSLAKLEALRDFLASIEMSLPKGGNLRPSHFNRILSRAKESEHAPLLHEVVLRTQAQAEYSPENIGHFGLNLRRYAHFTSPIRRYADLIVHRALIRALKLGEGGLPDGIEAQAARDRRADLGRRTAGDGGRARHHRPAGRALARRPHRRDLPRPHFRASRAPGCSSSSTRPAPTASCRCRRSARTTSSTTRRGTR